MEQNPCLYAEGDPVNRIDPTEVFGGVPAFKAQVLGGSAVALYSMAHTVAGMALGAVVVVNTGLAETFRRRPPAAG
ncbi:hypothetical protein [Streptomyces sp. NPDC048445]|uniref:hypothetical protein n=1 Tax=Streptomyces sp. NPDC048445 TaxID=3365553 RepID=UPI003721266F